MGATSAKNWKGRQGIELPLPSGNVALVRNPGMQHFLRTGVIPDPLTGMIRRMISGKEQEIDVGDFMQDDDTLEMALDLFDRVLCEVVVQPHVEMPPTKKVEDDEGNMIEVPDEDAREEEVLYADEVDFTDKTFIFQFAVGGTKDLEEFLQRQKQMLDSVSSGSGLADSSESTP